MEGIINVLKPPGMTSSDVVIWIRRLLKTKKVGHTGTLDPGVAGVLPICVGNGTRLAEYIMEQGKTYRAEVTFGITTDTQDAFGKIIRQSLTRLSKSDLESVLPRFEGNISQKPPMYSAVRKEGKHLYEYARQGIDIEIATREVTVYEIDLERWYEAEFPIATLNIECSKGTYIRTICHDLGEILGCGAHMSNLVRVRSGPFQIQESWTLEEIEEAVRKSNYSFLMPLTAGVDLPKVYLSKVRADAFNHGLSTKRELVHIPNEENPLSNVYDFSLEAVPIDRTSNLEPLISKKHYVQVFKGDELIGIGVWRGESLFPHKVFN